VSIYDKYNKFCKYDKELKIYKLFDENRLI